MPIINLICDEKSWSDLLGFIPEIHRFSIPGEYDADLVEAHGNPLLLEIARQSFHIYPPNREALRLDTANRVFPEVHAATRSGESNAYITIQSLVSKYGSAEELADAFLDRKLSWNEDDFVSSFGQARLGFVMLRRVFERLSVQSLDKEK